MGRARGIKKGSSCEEKLEMAILCASQVALAMILPARPSGRTIFTLLPVDYLFVRPRSKEAAQFYRFERHGLLDDKGIGTTTAADA